MAELLLIFKLKTTAFKVAFENNKATFWNSLL